MEPAAPQEGLTPPLRRHAALHPLSREHLAGLLHARNLRRAADLDPAARARAIGDFLNAWNNEIRPHFDDEERLLLPLTSSPRLRRRLLEEHNAVRGLALRCERDPGGAAHDAGFVRGLGELLNNHIRWEEREYFETLQREHPDGLAALMPESVLIEERRPHSRARCAPSTGRGRAPTKEPEP